MRNSAQWLAGVVLELSLVLNPGTAFFLRNVTDYVIFIMQCFAAHRIHCKSKYDSAVFGGLLRRNTNTNACALSRFLSGIASVISG